MNAPSDYAPRPRSCSPTSTRPEPGHPGARRRPRPWFVGSLRPGPYCSV
jgi:hypothetical protein